MTSVLKRIGRLPYQAALRYVRVAVRRKWGDCEPKVWARNSMVLDYLKPGVSDLDLTLYFEGSPTSSDRADVRKFFAMQRRLIPFLGEINVFCGSELESIGKFANAFELLRDPELKNRVGREGLASATRGEAFVFLLRMLEADYRNLIQRPSVRFQKWLWNFRAIGEHCQFDELSTEKNLLDQILERAASVGEFKEVDRFKQVVLQYLENWNGNASLQELTSRLGDFPEWRYLWPNRFCFLDSLIEVPAEHEPILYEQVRWEAFGALTQSKLSESQRDWVNHLENLAGMIERLDLTDVNSHWTKLQTEIRTLKNHIDG